MSATNTRFELPLEAFSPESNGNTKKANKLIIKGGNHSGNLSIDLDKVRSNVEYLKGLRDVRVDQLNPTAKSKLNDVIETVKITTEAGLYDYIYNIVKEVWSGVTEATPGTVGSYFVGCRIENNFSGNHACSATCAGSITPSPGTPGWSPCQSYSILFDPEKNEFVTLNKDPSNKENAYIFVNNSRDFRGFNPSDISRLKGIGVRQISIVKYSNNGKNYVQNDPSSPVNLDTLLSDGRVDLPAPKSSGKSTSKDTVYTGSSGMMFVFLIILIIIIIIIAFLLLRSGRALY